LSEKETHDYFNELAKRSIPVDIYELLEVAMSSIRLALDVPEFLQGSK